MVLVTVSDDNPLKQLHKSVIVLGELEDNWATQVSVVMDCVKFCNIVPTLTRNTTVACKMTHHG